MKNKKLRNDIILIAAVILIAAIALVCMLLFNKEGKNVKIYVDGALYGEYPLEVDKRIEIDSENGHNTLVISDGKASMTKASCPDLVCVNHKPISNEIDQIVCLPNKIVVSIE